MGPLDAFWHLLNLFVPAFGLGLLCPALAKALWRRELRGMRWWPVAQWSVAGCAGVTVAGLVLFGHDGRMATYAVMVSVCAALLWWRGWWARRDTA